MPSYVVVGASRGIGFALVKNLSTNPENTVIGIVRSKTQTEAKFQQELPGRKNIHILYGDQEKPESLKAAAEEASKITGGSLDILIANAAVTGQSFTPISVLATKYPEIFEEEMQTTFRVNVIGSIYVMANFAPLVLKGATKKIVTLSTGMGDPEFIADTELDAQSPYAISKAALNMAIAKFHAEYRKQGVLVMGISPGIVDTGNLDPTGLPQEAQEGLAKMGQAAGKYEPSFTGPITPDESANYVLEVVGRATMAANGGKVVSHWGNNRWL